MVNSKNSADFSGGNQTQKFSEKMSYTSRVMLTRIVLAFVVLVMIWLIVSGVQSKYLLFLTHDQVRGFVGILASVIPIFVVALYVDGASQWGTIRARGLGKPENEKASSALPPILKNRKGKSGRRKGKWSEVPVTPLQLLSALLGEGLALSCYLVPTEFLIRFATASMAALLGLFGYRLVYWSATEDDELTVRLSGALGGILLLWIYAGIVPYIFKISVIL